jgi:hypothetical protein
MASKPEKSLIERIESWPPQARAELVRLVDEIEAELSGGTYDATAAELKGIDRGLREASEGKFATDAEVDAISAKYTR